MNPERRIPHQTASKLSNSQNMKHFCVSFSLLVLLATVSHAQTNPVITNWLINTGGLMGSHYVNGNSTPIQDNVEANVQSVQYSANWSYISTNGIPAYPTGPFLDGNPSLATDQNAIFKFPLVPAQNTGTPTATTGGNIGVFINGVALFDYRDGVAWNPGTNALCGGPGNPPCPGGPGASMDWNRDAIVAERLGFDCSKGHPAMGNYHHHQNPSAFNLDLTVISTICNLYAADGLYAIDSTQHSPLVGFAYDGFPIYGAYAYQNTNGTGPIVRMKSGYHLRNITQRTTSPSGATVTTGPPVSTTYPLGYFREDYEFISSTQTDVLDEHNGRFCITPEYPNGTYAYFCTVDANWNSAYPYVVGPTFYGTRTAMKVTSITETTTTYTPTVSSAESRNIDSFVALPSAGGDFIAVQLNGLNRERSTIRLYDISGRMVRESFIQPGSTLHYLDSQTLYSGTYIVEITSNSFRGSKKIQLIR
jgi:hypothetical protein